MGQCRSNPSSPLTAKHMIEFMKKVGECKTAPLVAITGFNSNMEDFISGNSIALMIYYYSLHYAAMFIKPENDKVEQQ
jgi:hypothetical protein